MLTSAQLAARGDRLTASRVGILMSGDSDKVMRLWQEMVGAAEAEDLSAVWPVRLGEATEALNLEWYTRRTGRALSRHGEVVICPKADWAACTLDAFDETMGGPVDAKCVGGWEPRATVVERYTPQMIWQQLCTDSRWSALSIIEGGKEPVIEEVPFDEEYAAELWRRAEAFMACVRDLVPPMALAPVAAPVKAERIVDMRQSNAWAEHAAIWHEHRNAAKAFTGAEKELKALVAADARRAFGHGVECIRDRAGRLSIKEAKEA